MKNRYRVISTITGQQMFEGSQWECEDWIDEYGLPEHVIEKL